MKSTLKWALVAMAIAIAPSVADAQQVTRLCVQGSTGNCVPVDSTAPLPVTSSSGGSTTANQGTPNAGGATNSWPIQGAGVAGTPAGGVVSVQGVAGGTAQPVTAAQATASSLNATVVGTGTFAVQASQAPSSTSTAGVAPVQSASVETGHVIKASAGNLYDFNVSADATLSAVAWAVMIFNSTTVPASGAVTPVKCYLLPIGTTSYSGAFPTPLYLGTGISMAVSTGQTCFTKTDSAHGFISADAQ